MKGSTKRRIVGNKLNIPTADLYPHLTCFLCNGFLVDPYTIKECVHTFCKSCIIKFVHVNPKCPKCTVRLSSNPFDQLGPDRTLQGLIAKCFPKKVAEDAAAERLFYERLGMENPRAGDKRGRSEETPIAPRHAAPSPAAPAAVAATSSVSAAAASSATASPRARPVSPGPERAAKKAARSESAGELRRAAPPAPAQQQQQQQSLTGLASPKPMKSSMKKTAPLSQAAKESTKEIRFRLSSPRDPRIAIDKRVIFNAPRDSALKKIVPFLQNWLAQNGHTGGQLKFLRDGAVVSGDRSFLSLYGPTAGTQKDPATLEFFFE